MASPGKTAGQGPLENRKDASDTVIVPAQQEGFEREAAITTYAKVDRIEPYGEEGKYKLIFAEPAKPQPRSIPFADATTGSMQGPRYTSLTKLLAAKRVTDLFT